MASEDSDQLVPGFLAVHGLRDLDDLDEAFGLEMPAAVDELDALRELLEVALLRRAHRIRAEERNNRLQEIPAPALPAAPAPAAAFDGPTFTPGSHTCMM